MFQRPCPAHLVTPTLYSALTLPNGAVLQNRLAKAAMEENLAEPRQLPGPLLERLYGAWGRGGAGLIVTGNVMVDRRALTGPGTLVLDAPEHVDAYCGLARAARSGGAHLWMQLNHPGRQVFATLGQQGIAPSPIPVRIAGFKSFFEAPRTMDEGDIADVIARFARSAALAERAGFTGVQIHAAHGYLINQFLSPATNQRTDRWGGPVDNRARLLIEVIAAVKESVSPAMCVSVKLNSADFQHGGFSPDEARTVAAMLNDCGIDLLEISGGTYESPAMQGTVDRKSGSSIAREAYFLEFAKDIRAVTSVPLMLTGGVRRRAIAESALQNGIDVVGIARAMAVVPDLPARWEREHDLAPSWASPTWRHVGLRSLATLAVTRSHLRRLADSPATRRRVYALPALLNDQLRRFVQTRRYRNWIASTLPMERP